VVVDLAIDRQGDGALIIDKRLSARVYPCKFSFVSRLSWERIPTPTMLKRSWTRTSCGQNFPATLTVPEHLLVSLTITLPPAISQSMCSWRIQCGWLTPIWAPMSDTVRCESIEQDKSN
jgi:hypothetical protein